MKYGICTTMENYEQLCQLGFQYIELSGVAVHGMTMDKVREIRKQLESGGRPCTGFNAYCDGSLPIVGDGYSKAAVYDYAREMCEKGAVLGIHNIGIGSPASRRLPEGHDMKRADAQCEEFLSVTAEVAAEYNIHVLLESLNHTMCNYLIRTEDALAMVKRLQIDNLKLVLDFYQMALEDEDVTQIQAYIADIRHTHISGYEMDGSRYYLRDKDSDFCGKCVLALIVNGYQGTLSIEADTNNFFEDAKHSLKILQYAEERALR